jgi:hypothetical protein
VEIEEIKMDEIDRDIMTNRSVLQSNLRQTLTDNDMTPTENKSQLDDNKSFTDVASNYTAYM